MRRDPYNTTAMPVNPLLFFHDFSTKYDQRATRIIEMEPM